MGMAQPMVVLVGGVWPGPCRAGRAPSACASNTGPRCLLPTLWLADCCACCAHTHTPGVVVQVQLWGGAVGGGAVRDGGDSHGGQPEQRGGGVLLSPGGALAAVRPHESWQERAGGAPSVKQGRLG